jgi:hypothetical protein
MNGVELTVWGKAKKPLNQLVCGSSPHRGTNLKSLDKSRGFSFVRPAGRTG